MKKFDIEELLSKKDSMSRPYTNSKAFLLDVASGQKIKVIDELTEDYTYFEGTVSEFLYSDNGRFNNLALECAFVQDSKLIISVREF